MLRAFFFKADRVVPAALDARVLHHSRTLEMRRGRREGRVQAAPMARQQIKKLAAVTTGLAEQPGLPCAMVLTVSFVLSLGTGLSCSHRQRDHLSPTWPQRREAR